MRKRESRKQTLKVDDKISMKNWALVLSIFSELITDCLRKNATKSNRDEERGREREGEGKRINNSRAARSDWHLELTSLSRRKKN